MPYPPRQITSEAGRDLWRELHATYEFTPAEEARVVLACRQLDLVAEIEAELGRTGVLDADGKVSGLVSALRLARDSASRLVRQLGLPDPDADGESDLDPSDATAWAKAGKSPASRHAAVAAQARWNRQRNA